MSVSGELLPNGEAATMQAGAEAALGRGSLKFYFQFPLESSGSAQQSLLNFPGYGFIVTASGVGTANVPQRAFPGAPDS